MQALVCLSMQYAAMHDATSVIFLDGIENGGEVFEHAG